MKRRCARRSADRRLRGTKTRHCVPLLPESLCRTTGFTQIFNSSLELCEVPLCFKSSTILPVAKTSTIKGLNDYRPIALTSVVTKSFERLVLSRLKDITGPLLDPLQFAYRVNRLEDDAVNIGLYYILHHLETPETYARILFVDFSSAFNTIAPELLHHKLSQLTVHAFTCKWISSFLTNRRQHVRLGSITSGTRTTSNGAPQRCVLSPLLLGRELFPAIPSTLITASQRTVKLQKYADDTTVIGLIQNGDESEYRQVVDQLVHWCSQIHLELNPLKTVEMTEATQRDPSTVTVQSFNLSSTSPVYTSFCLHCTNCTFSC